jgi:peptidoglycan hydrolase-like protein with peptidoglycan-binding domain
MASRGPHLLCAALFALLVLAAPARAADPSAFDGNAVWIHVLEDSSGGDLDAIARTAHERGVSTVIVKASHGTRAWAQWTPELVEGLHERGLKVCAYSRILSRHPTTEARVSARAVSYGADCFVIDAEAEYESRYGQARAYVRELRRLVGPDFPVGLTSFPYVDLHPSFPYSVFLGPGGAQFNLPQVYWRAIGDTVDRAMARTFAWNRLYERPIHPIGQLWMHPPRAELLRFRSLAVAYGAPGASWWAWQLGSPGGFEAIGTPLQAPAGTPKTLRPPTIGRWHRGDVWRWAQRLLGVAQTGRLDARTARAVRRVQRREGLTETGVLDPPTWLALREP